MTYQELEDIIAHYRLMAEQSEMYTEQQAFRFRNFANVIETNIDLLEDAENEEDLWDFYNDHSTDGWQLLNPEDDY